MKKILFIDDDKILGEVVQTMLEDEGYRTILREDSSDIHEVINEDLPHCIILDYFLPNENGGDIAKYLKNDKKTQKIPIIMVSSHYGIEPMLKKIGVDAFIPKPFDIDQLVTTLDQLTV